MNDAGILELQGQAVCEMAVIVAGIETDVNVSETTKQLGGIRMAALSFTISLASKLDALLESLCDPDEPI